MHVHDELLGESLSELYENAPAGYLTTLPDGAIIKANETLARWTGYSKKDLLGGMTLTGLFTVPGRIYFETHVGPLLRMQGAASEIAVDIRCKDGSSLPVLMNLVLRGDSPREPRGFRATIFNAVERRHYERELLLARRKAEDAARVKSELLAMLGHDVRTPLSAIINVTRLLDSSAASPQQRQLVDILKRSSESLLDLINDILDYSRLEAGRLPVEERPFSIRALLENLRASVASKAAEKNIELLVDVDEVIPDLLRGDPVKIMQILMNLAGNALKFTSEGRVAVCVKEVARDAPHATLHFVVSDTGIGIAHDQLSNIFEEFTQANAEISSKYGGTGLGLAITRSLLALLGSAIHVETEPGKGSSFSFQLRLRIAEAQDAEGIRA